MKVQFNINDIITTRLVPGFYNAFIVGGFYITGDRFLNLKIDCLAKIVTVEKKHIRARCLKNWRRAIKYFEFTVDVEGEYSISAVNTSTLEIKSSQLLLRRLFQRPIKKDKIEIIIEQQ